ncbi:MAG: HEAT repeat domain-containing protein [Promethearchaeota archaeon]
MQQSKIRPQEIFKRSEELGFKNSANLLTEIIESDADDNERKEAIKYLALIGINSNSIKNECFGTFENLLVSDDKIEIKCEAAKALGRIKHEKGLKPLKWILEQEQVDNQIKLSVLKAIHKIRFEDHEIQLFINELDNNYHSIKDYVTIQLLSLNPEDLIKLSINSLNNKRFSNKHKTELVKLIGYELSSINVSFEDMSYLKAKYPEILTNLIQNKNILLDVITLILKEEDSDLLNSVIIILKLLEDKVEKDLIKLLLNDDFIVRKNSVILSGKLKLKSAVDLLLTNLDNIYNEVSIAAIEALGEIGELSAVPELLNVLDIEDMSFEYTDLDMKLYILDAIKKIYLNNKDATYEELFSCLNRDNNTIKESVAFILGEIGKEDFVKPLLGLLRVRNLDVRKIAIIALGKIGNFEPLDSLINILDDKKEYWLIKKVTIDAIYNVFQRNWYRIKSEDIRRLFNKKIALISEYLGQQEDENYKVKLGIIKLLETFGDEKVLSALLKRVNDFHRVVRIYASNAIKHIEERLEANNMNN